MISRKNILFVVICTLLTATLVASIHGIQSFVFARDSRGYDYDAIRSQGYDWTGPEKGEIIDLNYLTNEKSESLSEKSTKRSILITVVDPECSASALASDQIKYFQQVVKDSDYVVVSFSTKLSHKAFSQYLDGQNIAGNAFVWTGDGNDGLLSINKMVLPTHILVDASGKVIKTFPGTNKDLVMRERMANQVIKEISQFQ